MGVAMAVRGGERDPKTVAAAGCGPKTGCHFDPCEHDGIRLEANACLRIIHAAERPDESTDFHIREGVPAKRQIGNEARTARSCPIEGEAIGVEGTRACLSEQIAVVVHKCDAGRGDDAISRFV